MPRTRSVAIPGPGYPNPKGVPGTGNTPSPPVWIGPPMGSDNPITIFYPLLPRPPTASDIYGPD